MLADELCLDSFRDVKKAFMVQNTFDILPVLYWLFSLEPLRLFVFILQYLQPQSHAANAGFIRIFKG